MTEDTERTAGAERAGPEGPAEPIIYLPDQSQPAAKRAAPWRGRKRVADPYSVLMPRWRATPHMAEQVQADAQAAGLSYGAFMRAVFSPDGKPGPRSRRAAPTPEKRLLVQMLAELGKIGSNHNQLARAFNATGETPGQAEWRRCAADIQDMRRAVLAALGYGD